MGKTIKTSYMRLKKDIVIPAGTKFKSADRTRRTYLNGCWEHVFGLTKDSYGDIVYVIDPLDEETNDWFEEVIE